MKGTVLDFLKLAAEKPELTKDLADLATKYGFEFSDELRDDELKAVSGGGDAAAAEVMLWEIEKDEAEETMTSRKENIGRLVAMVSELRKIQTNSIQKGMTS